MGEPTDCCLCLPRTKETYDTPDTKEDSAGICHWLGHKVSAGKKIIAGTTLAFFTTFGIDLYLLKTVSAKMVETSIENRNPVLFAGGVFTVLSLGVVLGTGFYYYRRSKNAENVDASLPLLYDYETDSLSSDSNVVDSDDSYDDYDYSVNDLHC